VCWWRSSGPHHPTYLYHVEILCDPVAFPVAFPLPVMMIMGLGRCQVVPCFGVLVALIGSFTVTIVSFVLPPLFYLALFLTKLTRAQVREPQRSTLFVADSVAGHTSYGVPGYMYPLIRLRRTAILNLSSWLTGSG
jgi:hypothetical protein